MTKWCRRHRRKILKLSSRRGRKFHFYGLCLMSVWSPQNLLQFSDILNFSWVWSPKLSVCMYVYVCPGFFIIIPAHRVPRFNSTFIFDVSSILVGSSRGIFFCFAQNGFFGHFQPPKGAKITLLGSKKADYYRHTPRGPSFAEHLLFVAVVIVVVAVVVTCCCCCCYIFLSFQAL